MPRSNHDTLHRALLDHLKPAHAAAGFSLKLDFSGFLRPTTFGHHSHKVGYLKRGASLEVIQSVGVRVDALQDLLLANVEVISKKDKQTSASIGAPIAKLAGLSWTTHSILTLKDVPGTAQTIWAMFEKFGLPQLDQFSSPSKVLEVLRRNDQVGDMWSPLMHERCKCAVGMAFVMGQFDLAEELIEQGRRYLIARRSDSLDFFEEFVDVVRGKISAARAGQQGG